MDVMQPFFDISADPKAYARSWKDRTGGNVIGTLCSYAPEELILAAGALGFRIVGGSGAISKADAHLQAYSCSLVRGALEDAHGAGERGLVIVLARDQGHGKGKQQEGEEGLQHGTVARTGARRRHRS